MQLVVKKLYEINAFTNQTDSGNPAGLCLLDHIKTEDGQSLRNTQDIEELFKIADMLSAPTTAFIVMNADGSYDIRWLKPRHIETPLCGHATLATSHVLFTQNKAAQDKGTLTFHTRDHGMVSAFWNTEYGHAEIAFPHKPIKQHFSLMDTLAVDVIKSLGAFPQQISAIFRNELDLYVELVCAATLRTLQPDFVQIKEISERPEVNIRGIGLTARSDRTMYDIESRMFFPRLGTNEDFVCGSMHCGMIDYWQSSFGHSLRAHMSSPRPGDLWVRTERDQVIIGGKAIVVCSWNSDSFFSIYG